MSRPDVRSADPSDPDLVDVLDSFHHATTPREREMLEELVVERSARLVRSAAHRYAGRGIDVDDLTAVANLALVKAVRGFRADRGDFFAYASATMNGDLKKHFRDQGWTVRPPRPVQELRAAVTHAAETLRSDGHEPTDAELARTVGADPAAVSEARAVEGCFTPASLDAGPAGATLGDRLGHDETDFETVERWASFVPVWKTLAADDRLLLKLRFFDELSQDRIAPYLGISQMQVSRRLQALLARLRDLLADPGLPATV